MDDSAHDRLDQAMEERRVQLRMSWRDVANTAGISYEGLRAIRRGDRNPSAVTRSRIEEALRWEPGSVANVLAGGEPTPFHEVFDADSGTATEDEFANAYEEFEPGSLIKRVEELIRRRKERELDQALKLVEGQVDRDAG